jgi:PPOX class probable F420-dependent enzyme
VAHLATANIKGHPLNVPFCYVLDGEELFSPIDEKPKTSSPLLLKRILNIRQNPHVSVVVDRYDDDWERLAYVIITGKARVLTRGKRHQRAVACLRRKYPQYRTMAIHKRPIIHITPTHWRSWGAL